MKQKHKPPQHRFPGQSDDLRIANLNAAEEKRKRKQQRRLKDKSQA